MPHRRRKANRIMRFFRRHWNRYGAGGPVVWVILGIVAALVLIRVLDMRLRPLVSDMATTAVHNTVNEVVTKAVMETLDSENWSYEKIVTIQRDENGRVAMMQSNMTEANRLRFNVVESVLNQVSALNPQDFEVHLGSILGMDALSGRGPVIRVRTLSIGKIDAQLDSVFTAAGINQTRHQIMLQVTVPVTVFLASGTVKTEVEVPICAAETVIVGNVPEAYLNFSGT